MVYHIDYAVTYPLPWSYVCYRAWNKYPDPTEGLITDVKVKEQYIDENQRVHTTRELTCQNPAPRLFAAIFRNRHLLFEEKSVIDFQNKELHMTTNNLSYSSIVHIEEHCCYKVHDQNTSWTQYQQKGKVSCFSHFPIAALANRFEKSCASQYRDSCYQQHLRYSERILKEFMEHTMQQEQGSFEFLTNHVLER